MNKIVKYGTVSALSLAIGMVSGASINHYIDRTSQNVLSDISDHNEIAEKMGLEGQLRVVDVANAITLRDSDGKTFFALYNKNLIGDYSNLRYVIGDGFLIYNEQIMQYINNPNMIDGNQRINETQVPSDVDNVEEDTSIQNVEEYIESVNEREITPVVETEEDSLETIIEEESTSIDLSELILSDEEIESVEIQDLGEPVSEMFSIQETRKSERIVDELDFVDSSISGTTRDRALERAIPDEEERETFRRDVEVAAEENLRKEAIQRISNMIGDFTIDFKSETAEERRVITVFTDPTCPFCRRLHGDLDKMTMAGYTVRYLLIPKDGMNSPVVDELAYISCQQKGRALDLVNRIYAGNNINTSNKPDSCTNDILQRQLSLAQRIGGDRTPVIIDDRGGFAEGYSTMERMIEQLDASIR
jgi:hypothetical protein